MAEGAGVPVGWGGWVVGGRGGDMLALGLQFAGRPMRGVSE